MNLINKKKVTNFLLVTFKTFECFVKLIRRSEIYISPSTVFPFSIKLGSIIGFWLMWAQLADSTTYIGKDEEEEGD